MGSSPSSIAPSVSGSPPSATGRWQRAWSGPQTGPRRTDGIPKAWRSRPISAKCGALSGAWDTATSGCSAPPRRRRCRLWPCDGCDSLVGRRTVAIVRPPGGSFVRAESRHPERDRIDPERARAQHAAYCRLLEAAGVEVVELAPDEAHPDACFTQDPAIVLEGRALLGRFGALSRRGEEKAIADVLGPLVRCIDAVQAPATLEGGDLLRVGRRIV